MLNLECHTVGEFQQNSRLIVSSDETSAVLVDPGAEAERLIEAVGRCGATSLQIWLTHSHLDHCGAVADVVAATGAKVFGHQMESNFRSNVQASAMRYGLSLENYKNCPEPDTFLIGGEMLEFSKHSVQVLFTPGHSPGHLCFYFPLEKLLFAGDLVFQGSIGRTDLPGGDHSVILKSIKEKFLALPDDVVVMSGHGPDTTVGEERENNPFFEF
jgi:hydroxyacylglutathione hydrolase